MTVVEESSPAEQDRAAYVYGRVAWIRSCYLSRVQPDRWAIKELERLGQSRAGAEKLVRMWDGCPH